MKFTFSLFIFFALHSACASAQAHLQPPLTLSSVKAMIDFPVGSIPHRSLTGLVECWYAMARAENCTEAESAEVAFEKLSETVLSMAGRLANEKE